MVESRIERGDKIDTERRSQAHYPMTIFNSSPFSGCSAAI
jgi:hypothetical protein